VVSHFDAFRDRTRLRDDLSLFLLPSSSLAAATCYSTMIRALTLTRGTRWQCSRGRLAIYAVRPPDHLTLSSTTTSFGGCIQ
jgi:hypothetical protein